jgi:hypothetical protein
MRAAPNAPRSQSKDDCHRSVVNEWRAVTFSRQLGPFVLAFTYLASGLAGEGAVPDVAYGNVWYAIPAISPNV